MIKRKFLNPINVSFKKSFLIESSAGTGKTFTIILFFLRLILGLYHKNKPLEIEKILIVTFTEFAKQDIKKRIKKMIYELRISCISKNINHPTLGILIKNIVNFKKSIKILYLAELKIDKASIYTIHGFCYYILKKNMIISNKSLEKDIIKKKYNFLKKITENFWFNHINNIPINLAKIIIKKWKSPEKLTILLLNKLQLIKLYKSNDNSYKKLNFTKIYYKILNIINIFKNNWINKSKNIFLDFKFNKKKINKINLWSKKKTKDINYPKELIYLKNSYRALTKNNISNNFFKDIDIFINYIFLSKKKIFFNIIKYIYYIFNKNKKILDFDDIINKTYFNIKKNNNFYKRIYKKYPIAIIDEFHDTDYKQYKIFDYIYLKKNKGSLILIGDPKQSIYSFRGVNIDNYFSIRNKIKNNYYMNTNWRSSYHMIKSINFIFSILKKPFLSKKITFTLIKTCNNNKKKILIQNKKIYSGLKIWLYSKENIKIDNYEKIMANQCALNIYNILYNKKYKTFLLKNNKKLKKIKKSDITIIVKNYHESYVIQNFLDQYNISYNNYVSNNNSIFNNSESRELLYILQAVINPNKKEFLLNALSTKILNKNFYEIHLINKNDNIFLKLYYEFNNYLLIWNDYGIISFINLLIKKYKIYNNIIKLHDGYNRFNNFLKLIKILNKKFIYLKNKNKLLFWLYNKIESSSKNLIYDKLKYIKEENNVKIITVHKSKGLQYPFVWLPFISNFYNLKKENYENDKKKKNIIKKKILSEDLRILYVSLTRSIWHCSIGIAPIIKKKNKNNKSDFHKSAIGYLLQKGKSMDSFELKNALFNLINNIKYIDIIKIL
ncbi:UvrD-helicase domain-containing protein [Candidatus Annandia pinicola]|uniref:UvrD-helicase domain-containing protein n=1 Tax=Candidatus Annandia pinicola TaxID=1345117 RepID=UPI001D021B3C|nr:UvrD-helicase domain-containing protein [Candidatus Annandia pinicola]